MGSHWRTYKRKALLWPYPPNLHLLILRTELMLGTSVLCILLGLVAIVVARRRRYRLPPGPRGRPIVGNLFDIPTGRSWLGWLSHAKRYGALTYLRMFGTHIIALNDPQAAAELFEKRSAVFSERPQLVFGGEMCGWKDTLALLSYGAKFRMYRKELHQVRTYSRIKLSHIRVS